MNNAISRWRAFLATPDEPGADRRAFVVATAAVLTLAVAHRLYLLATTDFPINDGALFLEFVRGIATTFPALPTEVAFNGLKIPFAYPPLSFWLAAALTKVDVDPLTIVHVAPLLINIAYILLFALLLRRLGHSVLVIGLALFFFSTNFRSFEWLLMGGGLARGLGALLTLGALVAVSSAMRRERSGWGALVLAGVGVAGAVLSHPQWGIIAVAFAVALIGSLSRSPRQFVTSSLVVGITATVLVMPWVAQILLTLGAGPFLAAAATSEHGGLGTTAVDFLKAVAINPFIAIGAVVLLLRRDWFWLAAAALTVLITPRLASQAWALPIAVFAAYGALAAVRVGRSIVKIKGVAEAAVALAVVALIGWRIERDVRLSGEVYQPLKPGLRQAMSWVRANHAGARFAIVTAQPWYYDSSAEWFPVLTGARSVTTVQGREWMAARQFERWVSASKDQKADESCSRLAMRLRPFGAVDYIWAQTHRACFEAAGVRPIFANRDVAIYRAPAWFNANAAVR